METHNVWLATRISVQARSYNEATVQAAEWLAGALANAVLAAPVEITVIQSAQSLTDVALLALQLNTLAQRGGSALDRVAQLRAEVEREIANQQS